MKKLNELVHHRLEWIQPHALKNEYELRDHDDVVATIRWRSPLGTFATAESEDGCWTFKRIGFWQNRASVRECGSETDLAVFTNNTWSEGGTLVLPDGRQFKANTNFWRTRLEFRSEVDEVLFACENIGGVLHAHAFVHVESAGSHLAELPWMVLFAWYLVVMMQHDSAVVGGVVATMA